MATAVERLELLITGNARDAVAAFRETEVAATGLDGTTTTTAASMKSKMGAAAQSIGQNIQQNIGLYSVAAVGALAAAGASAVKEYTNLADKVRDFSRASGASAETSSRLTAIFDDLEISQGSAETAFFRLNRGIAEGTANLEQYGAQVVRSKDGNLDVYRTLLSISDAYKNTEDSGQRAALVQEAFGRGGKDLIPILEQGRDRLREMFATVPKGQILNEDQVERARQFKLALDDLNDSIMELKVAAGSELVPALTGFISYSADAIRTANEARRSVLDFAGGISGPLSDAFIKSVPVIGPTVGIMKDFGSALGFGKKESDSFTDSQNRFAEAQKELVKVTADGKLKTEEGQAAQREYNQAKAEYEGIAGRVSRALGDENTKLEEQKQKLDAAYASAQAYANSQLGVEGAALNVRAAQENYNKVLNDSESSQLDVDQATNRLLTSYTAYGQSVFDANKVAGDTTEEAKTKQIQSLQFVAGTLADDSPLKKNLNDYIFRLAFGVPRDVETKVKLKGAKDSSVVGVGAALAAVGNASLASLLEAIPFGAAGGIVNRATLAVIGEAGPEAVVPLNRTPGNGPLPSGFGTSSAGPTIVIPVHVGGRQVAEVVASELNRPGGPKITQKALVA